MNKEELKKFVEKKIYELQNCKTAVEITEHASYFTRLSADFGVFLRFYNPKSIDVLIEALQELKGRRN